MPIGLTSPQALSKPFFSPRWDTWLLLVVLGLSLAGLVALAATVDWTDSWAQVMKLTYAQIALLLALSLVNYLSRGLRWHLFATRLGLGLSMRENLTHFIGGFAMSITPGRVGELVRLRWIRRQTGVPFSDVLPLTLADRAFDVAALGLILAGCVLMSQAGLSGAIPVALLALFCAVAVTRPAAMRALVEGLYRLIRKSPRLFVRLRRSAASLALFSTPGLGLSTFGLSLISWIAEGCALYLLLTIFGAEIGASTAIAIFVFATLAGGLSGAPGGVGGSEAAMLFLLLTQGISMEMAVPAVAIIRITTLWFGILLGGLTFPFAETLSKRG